jgi:hypothetical protein
MLLFKNFVHKLQLWLRVLQSYDLCIIKVMIMNRTFYSYDLYMNTVSNEKNI